MAIVEPAHADAIAAALLGEYRSLPRLWSQSPEALARVIGDWPAVVALLASGRDALHETMRADLAARCIDPLDASLRRYLTVSMGSLPEERLRVLFLDAARMLIADEQLQQGTLAHMSIYPRTIFRRALELNAASIVLIHNHPSGDPAPSADDIGATAMIEQLGRSLDIELLDHIVVTPTHTHHMRSGRTKAAHGSRARGMALRSGARPPRAPGALILENARATMRRRMLRRQLLGAEELFGEPAWDMLLDVALHRRGATGEQRDAARAAALRCGVAPALSRSGGRPPQLQADRARDGAPAARLFFRGRGIALRAPAPGAERAAPVPPVPARRVRARHAGDRR